MANPTRILFVSDEVAPFTSDSEIAALVRNLPEQMQESGDYEVRIMMPRYGLISERRNRLHEVIRLSGTDITLGARTETLKVKVASIPGIRLQVYFMDNNHYFKRKGVYDDKHGKTFSDNLERSLFFGRSALETIRNLGWAPDVVHGFGWLSGAIPMLVRTTYADEPLFEQARLVYTPAQDGPEARFGADQLDGWSLPADDRIVDATPAEVGCTFADAVVLPPSAEADGESIRFENTSDDLLATALSAYDQVMSEVPA